MNAAEYIDQDHVLEKLAGAEAWNCDYFNQCLYKHDLETL